MLGKNALNSSSILLILFVISGCIKKKTDQEALQEEFATMTHQDLVPNYRTVYTEDSIKLEDINALLKLKVIDQITSLKIISNSCKELKVDYYNYLIHSYKKVEYVDATTSYADMGNIARFIIWKYKSNDVKCFDKIFENAELILSKGDDSARDLIIIGLFEGIQNVGGWHKIDYYKGFNKWLRPKSKKEWDDLIVSWEGK